MVLIGVWSIVIFMAYKMDKTDAELRAVRSKVELIEKKPSVCKPCVCVEAP